MNKSSSLNLTLADDAAFTNRNPHAPRARGFCYAGRGLGMMAAFGRREGLDVTASRASLELVTLAILGSALGLTIAGALMFAGVL